MISMAVLYHTLLIWGLAQVTSQVTINRSGAPSPGRSSMIANGWRPLTGYEGNTNAVHHSSSGSSSNNNAVNGINERHSGPHPVHGKLHDHMVSSEKLAAKQNKQAQDYHPPSILGSFSAFGHSVPKVRNNLESPKGHGKQVTSETREYTFLIPPPREPARYDLDPYRKVIIRDNDAYLRQPGQYIISHSVPQTDLRNTQFFPKGSGVSVSPGAHIIGPSKNRPLPTDYNGGISQNSQQHQPFRQQHIAFESLKLPNSKHYLQPPGSGGSVGFASEQQASDTLYNRYPTTLSQHNGQMSHDGHGNFYSQINHPSPNYKTHALERDPSFLVHESHEVSYATPSSPTGNAYGNFRPSTPYDNVYSPERYSTARPSIVQPEKFVPSKAEKLVHNPNPGYGQYGQHGHVHLENTIGSSEPTYSNGIANTYYISGQQSLTPPAPTWSVSGNNKPTPDINEVLPKTSRPPKFNGDAPNIEDARQKNRQQIADYLFPQTEVHQKQQPQPQHHYSGNPLALINQQIPETVYETPESISLKHFNEEQFKLQQQLLQRDRDRLRDQELQRQQHEMEFARIAALRNKEKATTTTTMTTTMTTGSSTQETPSPTPQYVDTTVIYHPQNYQGYNQDFHLAVPQQTFEGDYEQNPFQPMRQNFENGAAYESPSIGPSSDESVLPADKPEEDVVIYDQTEATPTPNRNRPRKPAAGSSIQHEQPYRRRKPTTTAFYEEHQQEQFHNPSTLAPNPTVQTYGSLFPQPSSTEEPTTAIEATTSTPETTRSSTTARQDYETTTRPRNRRPTAGNQTGGRRRRPTTTPTPEPDTASPVTYEQPDLLKYKNIETDASRRRRVKPSTTQSYNEETTTNADKKKNEIKHYGNKLGHNEQFVTDDFVTESESPPLNGGVEQVSQVYSYTDEQDGSPYTPSHDTQVTTVEASSEFDSSRYPTSSISVPTQDTLIHQQYVDHSEPAKNVHTSIPLEDLFVNTERITTTTTPPTITTTTESTTAPATTRTAITKSTRISTTTTEISTARTPSHRMRPMRFGNSTRPRFSIKDYKTRLDYRNRMSSTTTETPGSLTRHKTAASKNHYDADNQDVETTTGTTGRYRHMSRISHRTTTTSPTFNSRRTEGIANATAEKPNKFTPKRRLYGNHLYRSKISTSTTPEPNSNDGDSTTSKQNSVRQENVYSSAIRRRPQMKHSVYTQSSDIKSGRKDSTEMVPEETSYYPSAVSQLLGEIVTSPSGQDSESDELSTPSANRPVDDNAETIANSTIPEVTSEVTSSKDSLDVENTDDFQSVKVDGANGSDDSPVTFASSNEETGKTEALIKSEIPVTADSQLDDDLFAKASQSVADLTSSASALYDKPGMFKAVSVSPSGTDGAMISSRFKINHEKPTLPIEAFFHELTHKNE